MQRMGHTGEKALATKKDHEFWLQVDLGHFPWSLHFIDPQSVYHVTTCALDQRGIEPRLASALKAIGNTTTARAARAFRSNIVLGTGRAGAAAGARCLRCAFCWVSSCLIKELFTLGFSLCLGTAGSSNCCVMSIKEEVQSGRCTGSLLLLLIKNLNAV